MKTKLFLLISFLSFLTFGQELNDKLPVTNEVTTGKLTNGLTYYVRENKKPENRIFLRLVVNAGSVLENDSQQGLAHMVEHMAFNGTKNFEKNELINYLESIGMRFGADINAYTSFDETVYMLEIPADTPSALEKGFNILEDWAHNLSFDPKEIDKERGVVIEEWRLGRGANERMFNKQIPVLFKDSRYAQRMTIGKKDILQNAPYDTLKEFYHDWYRPSLMAVVAVGDLKTDKIIELIKKHFSGLKDPSNERKREFFPVPDQKGISFAIATDPEATNTVINIYHRLNKEPQDKVVDYRRSMVENLFNQMLNERLMERAQEADPPYIYAYSSKGGFVRTKDFYALGAAVKEGDLLKGLEAVLTESQKVKKFGFQQSELDRQKEASLKGIEQAFLEKDKTPSSGLADEIVRNFLQGEPMPGIKYEYELHKKYLPTITLEEVNKLASEWITEENSVVLVNAPAKDSAKIPSETEFKQIFDKISKSDVKAYEDKTSDLPLMDKDPGTSKITNEEKIKSIDLTEMHLSNGVRVILKNTNFKNDQILFSAFSPGGNSLNKPGEYIPSATAAQFVGQSGLGKFDVISLQKKLTGKNVNVNPYITEITEGISGSSSLADVETMFQLINLYFTEPRIDSSVFLSSKVKILNMLKNRSANPEAVYSDTINSVSTNYNYRRMPLNEKSLDSLDITKSLNFYKDRFADASDFTFIFVGNIDSINIKGMLEKYIGTLPSKNRKETWKDIIIDNPSGKISKEVYKGIEPKSSVTLIYTGDYDWNLQNNYTLYSMADVLRIKLREVLREDKGGTYGVSINASAYKIPKGKYVITVRFGCDPARTEELVSTFMSSIDSLKKSGVADSYIAKVKETQRREYETNIKENNFWLGTLQTYYLYNLNPEEINNYLKRVDKLTADDIKGAANKYFNNNVMKFVLYPEKKE